MARDEAELRLHHPVKFLVRVLPQCYRGLAKNAARSFVALSLANIYLARRSLA